MFKETWNKEEGYPNSPCDRIFGIIDDGNTLVFKYSELGSLVVKVQINGISLSNTWIDLEAAIDSMTK